MKQKQGGPATTDHSAGTSILRQQLQGIPCSNKYRKAQETLCKDCGKPYTTKCLLQVCRKSDEVCCMTPLFWKIICNLVLSQHI